MRPVQKRAVAEVMRVVLRVIGCCFASALRLFVTNSSQGLSVVFPDEAFLFFFVVFISKRKKWYDKMKLTKEP